MDYADIRLRAKYFWFFCQKSLSTSPKNCWRTINFWNKLFSCQYFEHFGQKSFRLSSRICLVILHDNNFEKKFIWEFCFLFSLTLSGKLSAFELTFAKHALDEGLCACKKNEKLLLFSFFLGGGVWLDVYVFCISDKNVEAVFSKLPSTYPEKNFRGICVQKTLVFDFCSVF